MVQRPASPTSLLWAHQLKKEHAHLLDRIKTLEATSKDVTSRMEKTEATAAAAKDSMTRVEEMAARIAAIEEDDEDVRNWISKLDEARHAQIMGGCDQMKSLHQKFGVLLEEAKKWKEERKEAKRREDIMLERLEQIEAARQAENKKNEEEKNEVLWKQDVMVEKIQELEAVMEADRKATNKLSRKNDPVDTKVLSRRMDAFESRRNEVAGNIAALTKKVNELESSKRELTAQIQRMQKELESARTPQNNVPPSFQVPMISSSTATTQLGSPLVSPPNIQVPRSPAVDRQLRNHTAPRTAQLQTSQLKTRATLRRSSRVAPRLSKGKLVNRLLRAVRVQSPMSESSLPDAAKQPADLANSSKKRKAAPTEGGRETRTQAKALNTMKNSTAPKPTHTSRHEPQSLAETAAKPAQSYPQKKKRRQIIQLHDA